MKSKLLLLAACSVFLLGTFAARTGSQSQSPQATVQTAGPTSAAIQKKIEAYLRHTFALGDSVKMTFGPLKETPVPGLYVVTVEVTSGTNPSDKATFYVSKDGRYLIRAELEDMNVDQFAEIRKKINLKDAPSKGPVDAKVVLVEFADFECPSCKQLDTVLRTVLPQFPQVRLVYKNYPLTQIHPWAMAAAEAGQCAYRQNPEAFWKFHDLLFDGQGFISPENVTQRIQDYASEAGLDAIAIRSCMSTTGIRAEVQRSIAEGDELHVMQTPTIFVNGRRLVAPDAATLDQYIRYELANLI